MVSKFDELIKLSSSEISEDFRDDGPWFLILPPVWLTFLARILGLLLFEVLEDNGAAGL